MDKFKLTKEKSGKILKIVSIGKAKTAIPSSFVFKLLSELNEKYVIYNINDFDESCYDFSNFEKIITEKKCIYITRVILPFKNANLVDEELNKSYEADQVFLDGITFESYKEMIFLEEYSTIYIMRDKVNFPKISKEKEFYKFMDSNCLLRLEVNPDGSQCLRLETNDKDIERLIYEHLEKYNKNTMGLNSM